MKKYKGRIKILKPYIVYDYAIGGKDILSMVTLSEQEIYVVKPITYYTIKEDIEGYVLHLPDTGNDFFKTRKVFTTTDVMRRMWDIGAVQTLTAQNKEIPLFYE